MKKTILSLAFISSALFVSAQTPGLNSVAAFDDFATTDPYSVETTELDFVDITKAAYKGIYWWTDADTDPSDIDYTWTRGTGALVLRIDKPYANYTPVGVGFGNYAASAAATSSTPFSLDLSANAVLSITLKAAVDTANVKVLFQLKDADGTILAYDKGIVADEIANPVADDQSPYKYQIGFGDNYKGSYTGGVSKLMADNTPMSFTYDFMNAVPSAGDYPTHEADNSSFDYAHVVELAIFFTNNNENVADRYNPAPLHNTFEITNFKLGNVTTIMPLGITSDEVAANNNEVVSVYDMMGKFVATGKLKELGLEAGKLYVVKSGNKSRKIVMN